MSDTNRALTTAFAPAILGITLSTGALSALAYVEDYRPKGLVVFLLIGVAQVVTFVIAMVLANLCLRRKSVTGRTLAAWFLFVIAVWGALPVLSRGIAVACSHFATTSTISASDRIEKYGESISAMLIYGGGGSVILSLFVFFLHQLRKEW